jgi:glycine/sarcosine N-methyltransferase
MEIGEPVRPDQVGMPSVEVRPLYGDFGWAYEGIVPNPAGPVVERVAQLLAELGPPAKVFVIDAGCGTGRYAQALAGRGFRVLGIDRSEALVFEALGRTLADQPPGQGRATFHCQDFLTWTAPEPVDAVLCRGVLNDLISDADRQAAFRSFSSWLRPGGLLIADVRDWQANAARYSRHPVTERIASRDGQTLRFRSETTLQPDGHRILVREQYLDADPDTDTDTETETETDAGRGSEARAYDFGMRCWTSDEVRQTARAAGFSTVNVVSGLNAGIAADRLLVTAHRTD